MDRDDFYRIEKTIYELSAIARRLIRLELSEYAIKILDVAEELTELLEKEAERGEEVENSSKRN